MENNQKYTNKKSKGASTLYLVITLGAFIILTGVFLLLPRSKFSELEKRELATPPQFAIEGLKSGEYASQLSYWFNDTEPYRDELMEMSMLMRQKIRLVVGGDEAITIHQADATEDDYTMQDNVGEILSDSITQNSPINDDGVAKLAHKGIVVIGTGDNVRALMSYGGTGGGNEFARVAKRYAEEMPNVRVYEMTIPLASEFYMPEKVKSVSKPQISTINNIQNLLQGSPVRHVDAYNALKAHINEDIYLRTDHHWAPLGAYYAAEQLAKTAGVPFAKLDTYQQKVVHRFVGTMYGYSQDISVKNAPEDFIYYVPTGVTYNTTFRQYSLNKDYQVTSESRPFSAPYFKKFNDGSGAAYSTFMGGDTYLTKVTTSTKNGRKMLIIKDSYGNAVPGYLFHSFEEIHVVDFRYFTHNIKAYCKENGITDLAFVFNIFNAYSPSTASKVNKFLTQRENEFAKVDKKEDDKTKEVDSENIDIKVNVDAEKPVEETKTKVVTKPDSTTVKIEE